MRIINRHGEEEHLDLFKIIKRISKAYDYCGDALSGKGNIDTEEISIKVIQYIKNGISTIELDNITSQLCMNLSLNNPDYAILGSRISISNHQKNCDWTFSECIGYLYNNSDIHNLHCPLVSKELYDIVMEDPEKWNSIIVPKRDYVFDYFGFKTLEKNYLLKTIDGIIRETPQYLFLRVSMGIWGDNYEKVKNTYDILSNKLATHATPTLFNAGTVYPSLSSCFLLGTDDNIKGIYKTISDCAMISKWAGGIGVHISNIRASGSYIRGTGGKTDGIVPMLKVYNDTARYVNQCFVPETVIYTKRGPVQIKDITKNDYVVTSLNKFKKVNEIFINDINKKILEIKTINSNEKLKCTDVHEIMVVKIENNDSSSPDAAEIHTKLESGELKREFIAAKDIKKGYFMCFPIPEIETTDVKTLKISDISTIIENFVDFGSFMEKLTMTRLDVLLDITESLLQDYSKDWSKEKPELKGHPYVVYMKNKKSYDVLRWILLRLGCLTAGNIIEDPKLESTIYEVILPRTELIDGLIGCGVSSSMDGHIRHGKWMYTPVISIEEVDYNGKVYDLNIEEQHDYLTSCGLVHNSGKRFGSIACFVKDTQIYTNNGVKEIQNVEIGDLVVTHNNRLRPVTQIHKNKLDKRKIYKLEVCRNKPIYVTGNHKFLSFNTKKYKKDKINFGWNTVEDLKKIIDNPEYKRQSCYISTPSSTGIENKEIKINVIDFCINVSEVDINKVQLNNNHGPTGHKINKIWNITEDFANLIGIWLGDGCLRKYGGKIRGIHFTVHNINNNEINFIKRVCKETFGCDTTTSKIRNVENIYVNSTIVGNVFNKLFKSGFNNKELPKQIFSWPKNLINGLIAGLITTDGHITKLKTNCTLQLSNEKLMTQLYHLCRANGIVCSFNKGNKINNMTEYPYSMSIPLSKDITKQLNKYYPNDDRLDKCKEKYYYEDNFLKILNITETDRTDEFVYTLGVEEDHSYMVEGLLAENCYIEPWHADVFDFLAAMRPHGTEERLAKDLFYALWIPDLFMKCVKNNDWWYLMCPDQCTGLTDLYGEKFEEKYNSYVESGMYRKKIKAQDLWDEIIKSQLESGMPYMTYKDNINNKSNQMNIGTIKSSNLCSEITLYSDKSSYAVCNLASIVLQSYVEKKDYSNILLEVYTKNDCNWCELLKVFLEEQGIKYVEIYINDKQDQLEFMKEHEVKTFPQVYDNEGHRIGGFDDCLKEFRPIINYDKLRHTVHTLVENIDKIIDINFYAVEEAETNNKKYRPIGIGVQGLADMFAKLWIAFESDEAKEYNKRIFEAIYYYSLEKSNMLAEKYGVYTDYEGSPISKGIFQFDMWGIEYSEKNSEYFKQDWNTLRKNIKKHGIRNSMLVSLMPTASTAQIMGSNESFEPFGSCMYVRRTISGEFSVINKYLMNLLSKLGLWNNEMKQKIMFHRGSIQNIKGIPIYIKNMYKTVWEIKKKFLIEMSVDRGAFICQSQSFNIYLDKNDPQILTYIHMYGWKCGLKTGSYYIRTKPAVNAQTFTIDPEIEKKFIQEMNEAEEEGCLMCGS